MSQEPDHGESLTVSAGGVTVEKTFAADEFPVPAIKFVVRSEREDAVDVRLSDDIPESFSMERVGFHPDYESANWTAYEDQFVEYERSLEPSEEVLTVYGIRLDDDHDPTAFLTEPMLETIVPGDGSDTVEDVIGSDSSRPVRNALADDATGLPGLDGDDPLADGLESGDDDEPPEPIELADPLANDPLADDTLADVPDVETDGDSGEAAEDDESEPIALEDPVSAPDEDDPDPEPLDSPETAEPSDDHAAADAETLDDSKDFDDTDALDADAGDEPASTPRSLSSDLTPAVVSYQADSDPLGAQFDAEPEPEPVEVNESAESAESAEVVEAAVPRQETGVAAALADEIRSGSVDDEDLELLREELDLGVPRSVDVRIRRLQSKMDDLEAYSDALAAFLDENGTAEELVTELRSDLESLSAATDELETELDGLRDERDDLDSAVEDVDGRVERVSGRLDGVDETVTAVAADVESLDHEMGEVRGDLADLDARIVSVEELGADERAELEAELDAIQDELEALDAFRDRLSSAFGGEQ
ncbi:hypothetical protein [Haloprofundus salilacus]|uniref:hypothetical protein n=1 Tax=Haloprofundus salilacus TaxID=2876190 RepID=UPI001CCF6A59|nr:hypothetical protein [Haloprofundus salilacus]